MFKNICWKSKKKKDIKPQKKPSASTYAFNKFKKNTKFSDSGLHYEPRNRLVLETSEESESKNLNLINSLQKQNPKKF